MIFRASGLAIRTRPIIVAGLTFPLSDAFRGYSL